MISSMAGEDQLVFHDFLGTAFHGGESLKHSNLQVLDGSAKPKRDNAEGGKSEDVVQPPSTSSGRFDDSAPSVTVSEQLSWPPGNGAALQERHKLDELHKDWQGKRRDSANSSDPMREQMQRRLEAYDTAPFLKKVCRVDDFRGRQVEAARADAAHSSMQPPRVLSSIQASQHTVMNKSGTPTGMSTKLETSKHVPLNPGIFGPSQLSHLNMHSALNSIRDSILIPRSPADEGSRTGLKGSNTGILLSSPPPNPVPLAAVAGHTNLSSKRSKSWCQSAGSESTYVARQQTTTPTSRQLTVFYGGQAHVFEEVPSDKAEAILTLAGSSGRSWSTMYIPRPKASVLPSGSEGPSSMVDREREKSNTSKSGAMDGSGVNPPEINMSEGKGVSLNPVGRGVTMMRSLSAGEVRKEAF